MKEIRNMLITFGFLFAIIVVWILIKDLFEIKFENFTSFFLGFFLYQYVKHSKHFD